MQEYVEGEFAKIGTRNKLVFETLDGAEAWVACYKHWNYQAAIKATEVRESHAKPAAENVHATHWVMMIRPGDLRVYPGPDARGRLDPGYTHFCGQPGRERAAAAHGSRRRRRAVSVICISSTATVAEIGSTQLYQREDRPHQLHRRGEYQLQRGASLNERSR